MMAVVSCRAVAVLVAVVCAGVGAYANPCDATVTNSDGTFTCRGIFEELKQGGLRFPSRKVRESFPRECGACRMPEPVGVPESPCSRVIKVRTLLDAKGQTRTCHAFAELWRDMGLAPLEEPSEAVARLHPECASSCRGSQ